MAWTLSTLQTGGLLGGSTITGSSSIGVTNATLSAISAIHEIGSSNWTDLAHQQLVNQQIAQAQVSQYPQWEYKHQYGGSLNVPTKRRKFMRLSQVIDERDDCKFTEPLDEIRNRVAEWLL